MTGLVIKTTGSNYWVHFNDRSVLNCYVKGNFRIRGIRTTNPVAVGDRVKVSTMPDGTNWITEIEDRKNYIIRRSTNLSKQSHILAANLDLAALIITLRHPETSLTFIDRFLATAEAYNIPACLIFNKIDLLSQNEKQELESLRQLYQNIGYPTLAISAPDCDTSLFSFLNGKITLLSGNSGVGKSTLLNRLLGKDIARTADISAIHDTGMHTTTFSEMYPYQNGWIIDTPGIKGFGMTNMQTREMSHYFREIFLTSKQCRFNNCTHTTEPQCAVIEAVKNGVIASSRYNSYLSMLSDTEEGKYR